MLKIAEQDSDLEREEVAQDTAVGIRTNRFLLRFMDSRFQKEGGWPRILLVNQRQDPKPAAFDSRV